MKAHRRKTDREWALAPALTPWQIVTTAMDADAASNAGALAYLTAVGQ